MRKQLITLASLAALAGSALLAQEAETPTEEGQGAQTDDLQQAEAGPEASGAHDEDYAALLAALPETSHSLASGIAQVAVGTEVPTEAKFEMEDGVLNLSVYTSEQGLGVIPEEAVFKEYKGDATGAEWSPETEVFEDFVHIARSAQYHTLLSMTDVTIPQIIETASAGGSTVFSVKAKVRDGRPVFEVLTAADGEVEETLYDLMSGEPVGSPATASLGQEAEEVQERVRVSVAGTIVELTLEQAAEACGLDVETLSTNQAALEAGAGNPESEEDTGATDAVAEDTAVVDDAEPADAVEDPTVPLPTADAVCEISRDRAEELELPAPD